ncbi:RyR domain-containing protein [Microbispora hainanensis]|uniref:RyR domain-containing protein n=1 Tax=Microbispora hainanensis TaxID=568844 RepID=UPI0033FBC211
MAFPASYVVRAVFAGLAVAALVTGYIGLQTYAKTLNLPSAPLDLLYWDLQLFVFDSAPLDEPEPLPALLEFARFAAPGVTIYTLVDGARLLFAAELRRFRARRSKEHVVVCGTGSPALALVERLRATSTRIVMIGSAPVATTGDRRVLYVRGDARSPATLRAAGIQRASVLYACEPDSSANTAIALAAHGVARADGRRPLSAYALISDPDLCAALRARRLSLPGRPRLRLDFFNLDELAARVLLDRHPIVNEQPVVVIGLDAFGRSLLVEMARRRRLTPAPYPLPVTVIDADAARTVETVCRRFEFVTEVCALTTYNAPPGGLPLGELLPSEPPQRVFVCHRDQDLALKTALTSLRLWHCGPGSLVVRVEEAGTFSRAFEDVHLLEGLSGALRVFAVNEEAGDPRLIGEDLVETLARAIHESYLAENAARRHVRATNPSLVPWESLPSRLQAANRRQAEDIGRKLTSIGCALAPRVEPELHFAFKDYEIEQLAMMEHERWLRDLVADGWTRGPARDEENRRHPDLDSWDNISDAARQKDRDTVRNLPRILATAGFQIVRVG